MNAGELNKRVILQSPNRTETASGQGKITSWTSLATVWAKVRPVSAREAFAYQQTNQTVTHEITIRYRSDVTSDCRILFKGRTLSITGVYNADEKGEALMITASEITATS